MKKILFNVILIFFIILTIFNTIFFAEIIKNRDLKDFYLQNKELPDNYSEKEKAHMNEVKELTNLSVLLNIASLTLLIFLRIKTNLKKVGISLIIISIMLLISAISFEKFFIYFHLSIFKSNNWLLPVNSTLITTYPLEFFRNRFLLLNFLLLFIGALLACWRVSFKNFFHNQ